MLQSAIATVGAFATAYIPMGRALDTGGKAGVLILGASFDGLVESILVRVQSKNIKLNTFLVTATIRQGSIAVNVPETSSLCLLASIGDALCVWRRKPK